MGKRRLALGFVLLLLVVLVTAAVLYIRPSERLDLDYTEIDWGAKVREMIRNENPELTINEQEFNQLAKKGLSERIAEHELPVEIKGANFNLDGNRLEADLNVSWGAIEAAVQVGYIMEFVPETERLSLTPESMSVRGIRLPPERFGLEPIDIDLGSALPDMVKVEGMQFSGNEIKAKLAIHLSGISDYLRNFIK
ncbi:hypothetical protein [Paenibacillus sp. DYY-L-2]|uniref:hypothetical protein n=1 Tax=Paenibacillus sp. DYY-L-2 TaxID=3447013 RepID=UPI003F502564